MFPETELDVIMGGVITNNVFVLVNPKPVVPDVIWLLWLFDDQQILEFSVQLPVAVPVNTVVYVPPKGDGMHTVFIPSVSPTGLLFPLTSAIAKSLI